MLYSSCIINLCEFNNIANINPLKVAGAGFIGAAIGAATGAFSYGVSVVGEKLVML